VIAPRHNRPVALVAYVASDVVVTVAPAASDEAPRRPSALTAADEENAERLRRAGTSADEIASALGVSRHRVPSPRAVNSSRLSFATGRVNIATR